MGFQKGDARVVLNDQRVTLRLTIGGLAEISARLSITGPEALQSELITLNLSKARVIFECLSVGEIPQMTDSQIMQVLPQICEAFENAFA